MTGLLANPVARKCLIVSDIMKVRAAKGEHAV